MGEYHSQYEKYYKDLKGKVPGKGPKQSFLNDGYKGRGGKNNKNYGEKLGKQLILQLIGALVLLVMFMGLKLIPLEGSKEAYIVTKEALKENIDIEDAVMTMNIPVVEDFKEGVLDTIDDIKSFFTGEPTLKDEIKSNYMLPVLGGVSKMTGENVGILIRTEKEENVLSSFGGKVKEVKEEGEEKHILIDHGNGVETYYGLLSSIDVKLNDEIEKGQIIGKTGALDSEETKGIVYKISYMGIEKDPYELLDMSNVSSV